MCGIAGYCINDISLDVLDKMLNSIEHRGHDYRGKYYNNSNNINIAMGHNRLSILDLSELSNQPYTFKNLVLIFNGEIYNFKELQIYLIDNGYDIQTSGDSEVIIKLFHFLREKAFSMLNGMFSIAIYDNEINEFYLSRDRLGVKPLIYYHDNNKFLFASEIKAFNCFEDIIDVKNINNEIITNYFQYGYVNSFDTVYHGVKKLKNGCYLKFSSNSNTIKEISYWSIYDIYTPEINTFSKLTNDFYNTLLSSLKLRNVADVKKGVFLSSGLDSNLITKILTLDSNESITTVTLKSLDYSETDMEFNSKLNKIFINYSDKEIWTTYTYLSTMYDEPFSDSATIGLYLLSKKAKELELKVILVGDGGDELLAGYSPYKIYLKSSLSKNPFFLILKFIYKPISTVFNYLIIKYLHRKLVSKFIFYHTIIKGKKIVEMSEIANKIFLKWSQNITGVVTKNYKNEKYRNKYDLLNQLNIATESELVHQLNYKTDIAGMLNTIEIREPLIDYRLFEIQQRISKNLFSDMLLNNKSKILFRNIFKNNLNCDVDKLQKKGFHIDLKSVFLNNQLEIDNLIYNHKSNFVDMNLLINIWDDFKDNKAEFNIVNRVISYLYWEKSHLQ